MATRVWYRKCVQCGKPHTEEERISKRGLCPQCGATNKAMARNMIAQRTGPVYNKWLRNYELGNQRAYFGEDVIQATKRAGPP